LRAWLVGFGFAVPALFITNDTARTKLARADGADTIVWLFLVGAAAQVLMAFVNKTISWCVYRTEDTEDEAAGTPWPIVRCVAKAENWHAIDLILDLVSMAIFPFQRS
jgi:hypothetical protein